MHDWKVNYRPTEAVRHEVASASEFHLAELDHGGKAPTMLCGYVGNLQLVLNRAEAPRASEWTSYLRSSIPEGRTVTMGLVYAIGGGGPNAAQRQEATAYWKTQAPVPIRIVLLTDVALHRQVLGVETKLHEETRAASAK